MKMSLKNSLNNGVNEARTDSLKVSRPAVVLRVSSVGLVFIKIRLERNGQKRKTRLLYLVTCKQRKKVNEDVENECIIYGMRLECLKLRSNTLSYMPSSQHFQEQETYRN